jgi:GNAT superfamily N-acetyltransferase
MSAISALARRLLGDYEVYRIYGIDVHAVRSLPASSGPGNLQLEALRDVGELEGSAYSEIRSLAEYQGDEAFCFVARRGREVAAGCWFWTGERYRRRNFWPLAEGEAKLVQITTAERHRGGGIGAALIRFGSERMVDQGYRQLYARVWHSNRPSVRVFQRAGWRFVAAVVEFQPLGIKHRFRCTGHVPWRRQSA